MTQKVGIVVPTLGTRPEYLAECLESLKRAGQAEGSPFVVIVAPSDFDSSRYLTSGKADRFVEDPGQGLAAAINSGFAQMPEEIEYINWLGDDDVLKDHSLDKATSYLESNPKSVMVFGGCDYVDSSGHVIWTNPSGLWAVPLLRFGPDLVPQPGSLFRSSTFAAVKGLDSKYDWAFDFDLFIKFSKIGKIGFINETLASFRWHPDSLSVEYRARSVNEASEVRVSHLPKLIRWLSSIWEFPVKKATLLAGNSVSKKARRKVVNR